MDILNAAADVQDDVLWSKWVSWRVSMVGGDVVPGSGRAGKRVRASTTCAVRCRTQRDVGRLSCLIAAGSAGDRQQPSPRRRALVMAGHAEDHQDTGLAGQRDARRCRPWFTGRANESTRATPVSNGILVSS